MILTAYQWYRCSSGASSARTWKLQTQRILGDQLGTQHETTTNKSSQMRAPQLAFLTCENVGGTTRVGFRRRERLHVEKEDDTTIRHKSE